MKTRIPRKLKKKYKKMGIWNTYLNARDISVEELWSKLFGNKELRQD